MNKLIEKLSYIVFGVKNLDRDKFYWRKTDNIMCRRMDSYCPHIELSCRNCVMMHSHSIRTPCEPPVKWEKTINPRWKNYPELVSKIKDIKTLNNGEVDE